MRLRHIVIASFLLILPAIVSATPNPGTYNSTDLGGQLLTGRGSTWRPGVNSGFPHVVHAQSWNGSTLGTQWDVSCPTANGYVSVVDSRVAGDGDIVYTTNYTGGTFTFSPGGWPWGDGAGTLNTTHDVTSDHYISIGGISTLVGSRSNVTTSGVFDNGCVLTFSIANGTGICQTPFCTKPATYPTFLDGTCAPALPTAQFGGWGDITQITMNISCVTETKPTTWGHLKMVYR